MTATQKSLVFFVNGHKIVEDNPNPTTTLLQYLRRKLKLTGTKNGCNQGGCGSCTVMMSWWHKTEQQLKHSSVNACLILVCQLHGYAITTVEGVGSTRHGLSKVQTRLIESFGIQCGFCTPGMVMTMHTLLQNDNNPSEQSLEKVLEGNLCRCTGYRPIVDAFRTFCKKDCSNREECAGGDIEDICRDDTDRNKTPQGSSNYKGGEQLQFPNELQNETTTCLDFRSGDWCWFRPLTLGAVLSLMDQHSDFHIIMGATNLGEQIKTKVITHGTLISCTHVEEMMVFEQTDDCLTIGAALTLTDIAERLEACTLSPSGRGLRGHVISAMQDSLRWLANQQIRNQATLGGHVTIGDPRSDLCVVLMAAGATAVVASKDGSREIELDNQFFITDGIISLGRTDILVSVKVPINPVNTYVAYYKQPSEGYAALNGCFYVSISESGHIDDLSICFGSALSTTRKLVTASSLAKGRCPDNSALALVCDGIERDFELESGVTVSKYKQKLACSFMVKFLREIQIMLKPNEKQDVNGLMWTPCEGQQVYQAPSPGQPAYDTVGCPVPIVSSPALATGEAMFLDDMPRFENELYVQPVLSTRAHAQITCIDKIVAMATPGVVDFLDASSVPGENLWGLFIQDEPLFAEHEVFCVGQIICAIVATSEEAAQRAADLVRVTYVDLPSILTIEEAIAADSYFEYNSHPIECGDPDKHFPHCDFVVEGLVRSGLQEHFYLEPSGALVVPKNESGEMEIFTTSQTLSFCQSSASRILGIPMNKIIVRQKRLGGGFGGREYRTPLMFGPAAVAAHRWGKPARTIMERSVDFKTTGKRHEFMSKYKILDTACFKADAAYKTPVFAVYGHICKTNIPSNTSMRSFGTVEAVFVMEAILCKVADTPGLDQEHVRELNMYKEGSLTHYKRKLENCMLQRCWRECMLQSKFGERKTAVDLYNSQNKYTKRGIAVIPVKFGIGYPVRFLNQGAAFVNIYLDGSVMIAHGGVEMGQGLHTKMIQVASRALDIPMDNIYISETGTNTCPNTTSTSASVSSDLQGAAVLDACRKINKRLRPFQEKDPSGQWTSWINMAYMDRVSLSATGIGRPGNQQWDHVKGEGSPSHYYTYGAACTEVEIDCLTGAHQVLQTDIVMDIGDSLNPGIDVGQIEGGFVQGYGLITKEELKISPKGHILASGPVDYKIPGVRDIPRQMKVYILKDCPNTGTVYSSKGVGEPPLNLAISVYIALREAIRACRMDVGISSSFEVDIPLTSEKIRMACPVKIPTNTNQI
ncbi:xanthine dehydrogenase/oxidase-like isoform X2 [Mizuhopecten yessoensis]|uniref:xanthine dehydrogenase/oxidase-like isoform X2 n=1 Tax=Mizuhopecten yessoensis TaxID=6573 RepID=UPI000B45CCE3|nr:xanthine dehydrogenase/oxidase-like isoform X2 [Mizuhopecten yessoensis]